MSGRGFAIVLPARYHSSRFPGKPLALVAGRPLIELVYERAKKVRGASCVVVATDDERIARTVRGFGGDVVMTSSGLRTGTDRVAEVAGGLKEDYILNLQGDEPVFPDGLVEEMVGLLQADENVDIVTACHPIENKEELENPNVVKVVMDKNGNALYFSRAPIPFGFGDRSRPSGRSRMTWYRHVGIYAFRKASLLAFARLEPSELEVAEGLEQLRALEAGMRMRVVVCLERTVGVDVPEDIKNVEKVLYKNYNAPHES